MSVISLDPNQEKHLVYKAQKNVKNFSGLYEHYYPHIKRFLNQRVYNTEDVEDLTSIVFEKAIKGIHSFKWQGVSFSSWLYKIARNTLIDYYRKQDKTKRTTSIIEDIHESRFKTPEQAAIEYNQSEFMSEILKTLDDREQKIVYLKFFEGRTNQDIADELNLTETNISTIVYRVMKKLKKKLDNTNGLSQ